MARIAYVNGSYIPMANAYVHINDRGYQFADGVYEGISVRHNRLIDLEAHLDRLQRSMDELAIVSPMARRPMAVIFNEVMRLNRIKDGFIYVQVTRGVAARDHGFPDYAKAALVVTCRRLNFDNIRKRATVGVAASTQPDIRWGRCDIKSTSLLPNILAKQAAREEGAFEAVLVDKEHFVTEGSSTNMWIVKDGRLITRSVNDNILAGITLARIKEIATQLQITIEERAFSVDEAKDADEMFFTSSTNCAMPIVELDGKKISDGTPGPVAKRLLDAYFDYTDS